MTVPEKLRGAWRRTALHIDGRPQPEMLDVLWLQSDELFADMRVPLDPAVALPPLPLRIFARPRFFAGRTSWTAPMITWEHLIDGRQPPRADVRELEWRGAVMVEHGTIDLPDRTATYAEEWVRLTDGSSCRVDRSETSIGITVAEWGIEATDQRPAAELVAVRRRRDETGWRDEHRLTFRDGQTVY